MTDTANTRNLVERAVAGDRVALERLMLDHYAVLARQIEKRMPQLLRSTMSPEDVVQLTYSQVFTHIGTYRPRAGATFLGWMLTIAENRLRDAIRAQRRKKRGGGRLPLTDRSPEQESRAANLLDVISASGNTPSQSVARREGIRALQVAVAGLPDDYRQAVELRYFEGYSLAETAERMGRTTGAVRGLLDRAKKELRDALERASRYLSTG